MCDSDRPLALKMVRWNLDQLPDFALPPGFQLRSYEPGDEEIWRIIHLAADHHNAITSGLFSQQFGSDRDLLRQRQLFLIEPSGDAIGTGTAWFNNDFRGQRFGRVHWVAVVPAFQGRGLSKPLVSALCHRLRQLEHDCAYLSTNSARLAAIRLYAQFGFEPLVETDAERAAWRALGFSCDTAK